MVRYRSLLVSLAIVSAAFAASPLAAGKPPSGSALGVGTVFLPNPVADLGDETLTDQKDADYPALARAYHDVVLTNLDGSGFLVGDWAQVHHDGQIWSRALWDIRQAIGNVKADTLILEAQFDFPGTTMRDLAATTLAVANGLYGRAVANQVRAAFVNRGLLP